LHRSRTLQQLPLYSPTHAAELSQLGTLSGELCQPDRINGSRSSMKSHATQIQTIIPVARTCGSSLHRIRRLGLRDVTEGTASRSRTGSYWRWLSSGMLSNYIVTAAGQALWIPGNPDDSGGVVSDNSVLLCTQRCSHCGARSINSPIVMSQAFPCCATVLQEHCIHAFGARGNKMNDVRCDTPTFQSIPLSACCQVPAIPNATPTPSVSPTPTSSPRSSVCPLGFSNPVVSAAGTTFCYAVAAGFNGAGLTWHQALASCESKGAELGSLAAIRDLAQQTAVITNRCSGLISATTPATYW